MSLRVAIATTRASRVEDLVAVLYSLRRVDAVLQIATTAPDDLSAKRNPLVHHVVRETGGLKVRSARSGSIEFVFGAMGPVDLWAAVGMAVTVLVGVSATWNSIDQIGHRRWERRRQMAEDERRLESERKKAAARELLDRSRRAPSYVQTERVVTSVLREYGVAAGAAEQIAQTISSDVRRVVRLGSLLVYDIEASADHGHGQRDPDED